MLITGGLGYIGQNLLEQLENPLVYDIKDGDDILDITNVAKKMREATVCYHLAAVSSVPLCEAYPVNAIETNIIGTLNILKAAKEKGVKVVFASSFAVYTNPNTIYGMTKILGEKIVEQYGGVVCRIANVYGGKGFLKKETAVSRLMKGTFEERGHGQEKRDFIHIDEVCKGLIRASVLSPTSVIDICTGKTLSIDEIVDLSNKPDFPMNIQSYERGARGAVKIQS